MFKYLSAEKFINNNHHWAEGRAVRGEGEEYVNAAIQTKPGFSVSKYCQDSICLTSAYGTAEQLPGINGGCAGGGR